MENDLWMEMQVSSLEVFHHGDKEILLGVEWDYLHDDDEVNLVVALEIHHADLEEGISFEVEREVSDGEKLIVLK